MQKKLCLLLSLPVYWLAESAPAGISSLGFDKLNTDLKDLKYDIEEEDLDDFSKLLDEASTSTSSGDQSNTGVKTSGFKKKNASNKGSKAKYDIEDLKKFFKAVGAHDRGAYDDDDEYAKAKAIVGTAVGTKGKEDRKYRKGTKTRGFHRVHHKDEYNKDKIFYEDDETSGAINKVGAKGFGVKVGVGEGFNRGHFHRDQRKGIYGKQGYLDKGYADNEFNDSSDSQGFDGSFSNES